VRNLWNRIWRLPVGRSTAVLTIALALGGAGLAACHYPPGPPGPGGGDTFHNHHIYCVDGSGQWGHTHAGDINHKHFHYAYDTHTWYEAAVYEQNAHGPGGWVCRDTGAKSYEYDH